MSRSRYGMVALCALAIALLPPVGKGHAATTTLYAADDIMADATNTYPYPGDSLNWVGDMLGFYFRAAVKFDLGSLPGSVTQATLRLRVFDTQGSPVVNLFGSYDDSWSEAMATIASTQDVTIGSVGLPGGLSDTWQEYDVTGFVASQAGGDRTASLVVTGNPNGSFFAFYSDEDPASKPQLVVTTNSAPVNAVPATQTTIEDSGLLFSSAGGNGLSVSDFDGDALTTTLSVPAGKGVLTVTAGGGASIVNNGTNSVQVSGTVAQVNAALASVTYAPPANANGSAYAAMTMTTFDGRVSDTDTVTINVTAVNDLPSIGGTPATSVAQESAYGFMPTASDADAGTLTFSIVNKPAWASFNTATGALTGTPGNSHVGTTNGIVITVSDGTASVSLPAFNLTVTNVNDAPVIGGSPATSVAEESAYSFTPTASDVDAGDTLTFTIANKPAWASFNTATGALTGTPGNSNVGTTSGIVITVYDAAGASASLPAFNLTVTNVNDAPTIGGVPTTSVAQGSAYSFTPTASDIDAGDALTFSIANKPAWASLNTATGALTGTPGNSHVGTTSGIVITVSDGTASVSLPPFNLAVTNVNDAPVIGGSPATSVAEESAYSFTPTAGDVDAGDTLTFSIVNKPAWASFNTATGALTGTPGNGHVGTTSGIVITVSDAVGASASLPVFSLTVTNVNDAPVISGSPATSVAEGSAFSFTPTASDIDAGETLTFTIANKPAWASFNTATGALTGTPGNSHVGTTSGIVITVSDGVASVSLPAFNLTVTNVNDAPSIGGIPATSVAEGSAYGFTPAASDIDAGDTLTFTIVNKPAWASFNTATGALTGTPGNGDVGTTGGIVITVRDAVGASASLSAFSLTVTNVNDAPVIGGSPATSVAEGSAYSFTPTASDIDAGETLTFTIANKPAWANFNTATGALTGTPGNANVGTASGIVITVRDAVGAGASLPAFNLTVTNVNDAPSIGGSPATSVAQGGAYGFTPTASDVDAGDTLSFAITNKPVWASFNTATGALTGTPGNGDVGTTNGIVITVRDASAVSASLPAFSLTVVNVNDAPVISGTPAAVVAEESAYSFTPSAGDVDAGDALTFSIANKPAWASFNPATGALTGTPGNGDVGTTQGIVITVRDAAGASASLPAFDLMVANVNDVPSIGGAPATSVAQGGTYSFTPTASDIDAGDALTFSIANKPAWATFSPATGALTGVPGNGDVGTTSGIVITVSDGAASASLPAFNLTVTNVNDAPMISGTPGTSVAEGAAYGFTPTAVDVDAGATLSFTISNKPAWASFDPATGALVGMPGNGDVGTTGGIVISVSDGVASASLPPFDLTVTNVNDAPTIGGTPGTGVAQDAAYSFIPSASDIDAGETLTFGIANKPAWANFDPATGALAGTPGNSHVGTTHGIVITVRDAAGASASLPAFSLTVTNVNDAPVISGAPPATVAQDATYGFTPTASDIDAGDILSFNIVNKPAWASFNTATGALTGTPGNSHVGTTGGIVITVTDGAGLSASLPAFSLTVVNVNDAPVIGGTPGMILAEGSAYGFTPTASDIDAGDTLSFAITNRPGWATFNSATGALTGTPGHGDVGTTHGIVITVRDAAGASASLPAFNLTVTSVNGEPAINTNTGLTVTQGSTRIIPATALAAIDIENGPAQLTFTLLATPAHGELRISDTPLGVGSTFTQQQIDDGALGYVHDGGTAADDRFTFRVTDAEGLATVASDFLITVDLPPQLVLSMLVDGSVTAEQTLNVSGRVSDDYGVAELRVNAQPVAVAPDGSFSHALVLVEGANTVAVAVVDSAGQQVGETRTVKLDLTAPELTITAPADNSKSGVAYVTVTGATEPDALVELTVNGGGSQVATRDGAAFSATVTLAEGLNTIDITAADPLGNRAALKRTVTYDAQAPTLAVTAPAQDATLKASSLVLEGTVADLLGEVTVTVTLGSQSYTPQVVNGAFRQELTLGETGTHAIIVTAADDVGHSASVQRNVIFDPRPLGDVDGNGRVDISDALLVLRVAVGLETGQDGYLAYGDVAPLVQGRPAPDGNIGLGDAVVILQKVVGMVGF